MHRLQRKLGGLLLAATAVLASSTFVHAAPVCPLSRLGAGNYTFSLSHGGRTRSYRLHVPTGLNPSVAIPVVLSMHGLGSSASQQQSITGWDKTADKFKFVVAYPQGVSNAWNVVGFNTSIDDNGFLKAVVDHVSARVRIAPNRVYLSGVSLGGGLAHRMACDEADYYAAAAPFVFHLQSSPPLNCSPIRPIAVREYAGLDDRLVPYNGGFTSVAGHNVTFLSAQNSFRAWGAMSGCTGSPVTTFSSGRNKIEELQTCTDGVRVGLASLAAGHGALTGTALGSPTDNAWSTFLSLFSTPNVPADACAN